MGKIIADSSETGRMEVGISTCLIEDQSLNPDRLDALSESSLGQIELFANRPHLDYHNRTLIRNLAGWFNSKARTAPSLHLPFFERRGSRRLRWISGLDREVRNRRTALDELKRALEFTDYTSVSYVVAHLGVPRQTFTPVDFEYAFTMIDTISRFADVRILIENTPNEISNIDRIREFLHLARLPKVGICYDSGHGELDGTLPDFNGVGAVHLSDSDGHSDEHVWPFEGRLNWPALVSALVRVQYQGPLVLEGPIGAATDAERAASRVQGLFREAHASVEEFRRKYDLSRRDDESDIY